MIYERMILSVVAMEFIWSCSFQVEGGVLSVVKTSGCTIEERKCTIGRAMVHN
jgi:hypothetical protein